MLGARGKQVCARLARWASAWRRSTRALDVSRASVIVGLAVALLSGTGCTFLCHYTAAGHVSVPAGAAAADRAPLDKVVADAVRPLGFSDGSKIHIPGYPLGNHKYEPDHDYVDFSIGVPAKVWSFSLPDNQLIVRVEVVSGAVWISDLRHDATQKESSFFKHVRESIRGEVRTAYGTSVDLERVQFTSAQCVLAGWP